MENNTCPAQQLLVKFSGILQQTKVATTTTTTTTTTTGSLREHAAQPLHDLSSDSSQVIV